MAPSRYPQDYITNGSGWPLPLRWLAPEIRSQWLTDAEKNEYCIGINESLWSLGVTLWEVGSLCAKLPFASVSDEAFLLDDVPTASNIGTLVIKAMKSSC